MISTFYSRYPVGGLTIEAATTEALRHLSRAAKDMNIHPRGRPKVGTVYVDGARWIEASIPIHPRMNRPKLPARYPVDPDSLAGSRNSRAYHLEAA